MGSVKIVDSELASFANSKELGKQVVIIQMAAEPIRLKRPKRGHIGVGNMMVAEIASGPTVDETLQQMDELEEILRAEGIYDSKTTRLDSAKAYAVQVTPQQLLALTELPLVAHILPNTVSIP